MQFSSYAIGGTGYYLYSPNYTLGNNFLSTNAYVCVELNAHSLLTYLITVRDTIPLDNNCFLPWLLGSQSCEKIFRLARSMSSTFSTVINFGILGLLRRLNRLKIQSCLEAEGDKTGINEAPKVQMPRYYITNTTINHSTNTATADACILYSNHNAVL